MMTTVTDTATQHGQSAGEVLERRLGYWETLCQIGHEQYAGNGQPAFFVRIAGRSSAQLWRSALGDVYRRHPLLRARVVREADAFRFRTDVPYEEIPVVFHEREPASYEERLEAAVARPVQSDRHLWRADVFSSAETQGEACSGVVITMHHTICDAVGAIQVLHQVLFALQARLRGTTVQWPAAPLRPPLEDLIDGARPSWEDYVTSGQAHHGAAAALTPWPYHRQAALAERRTRLLMRRLGPVVSKRLNDRAQEEDSSVGAALCAATGLAAALARGESLNVSLHTAVDLRAFCNPPVPMSSVGSYVNLAVTRCEGVSGSSPFWDLARRHGQQLRATVPRAEFCPAAFSLAAVQQLVDREWGAPREHFKLGFGVSYWGQTQFGKDLSPLRILDVGFGSSRVAGDVVLFVCALALSSDVKLVFNYAEPLLTPSWVERFADDYVRVLEEA